MIYFASFPRTLKLMMPNLLALFVILLSFLPFPLQGVSFLMPLFDVMIIFYWSIYYPRLFPAWFVLVMGLMQDLLTGLPLGLTSSCNLIFREIIVSRRRFFIKEPFVAVWFGFAMFSFIIVSGKWVIACIVMRHFYHIDTLLIQWLLTASLYAWMHWLQNKIFLSLPIGGPYGK